MRISNRTRAVSPWARVAAVAGGLAAGQYAVWGRGVPPWLRRWAVPGGAAAAALIGLAAGGAGPAGGAPASGSHGRRILWTAGTLGGGLGGAAALGRAARADCPVATRALRRLRNERYRERGATLRVIAQDMPVFVAVPEEVLFRGVLFAAVRRLPQRWWPLSAGGFGLWHVAGELATRRERVAGGSSGSGAASYLPLVATVLATALAGRGFEWLRERSGGVEAAIAAHWVINALGAWGSVMAWESGAEAERGGSS